MSFSLINPTGWTTGDLLTEDQINQLDNDHAKAIDGTNGGSYFLLNPLILDGANVTFDQAVIFGDAVTVGGDAVFNENVYFNDASANFIVSGASEFNGFVTFNQDVTFDSFAQFNQSVDFNNSISANDATFSGAVQMSGTSSVLSFTSGGRYLETGIVTNDADQSIDVTRYRHIHIPSSVSTSRTYTLTGSVVDRDWFYIHNNDTNTHTIDGLISIPNLPVGRSIKYMRLSGNWYIVSDSG